jgi:hypothetical protein
MSAFDPKRTSAFALHMSAFDQNGHRQPKSAVMHNVALFQSVARELAVLSGRFATSRPGGVAGQAE